MYIQFKQQSELTNNHASGCFTEERTRSPAGIGKGEGGDEAWNTHDWDTV